jgi:hypothetical protein
MLTPVEYRALADDCFRWAREATMESTREAYIKFAQFWLEVAIQKEDETLPGKTTENAA